MVRVAGMLWSIGGHGFCRYWHHHVLAVPSFAGHAMSYIPYAALAGFILAIPVAFIVARMIDKMASRRRTEEDAARHSSHCTAPAFKPRMPPGNIALTILGHAFHKQKPSSTDGRTPPANARTGEGRTAVVVIGHWRPRRPARRRNRRHGRPDRRPHQPRRDPVAARASRHGRRPANGPDQRDAVGGDVGRARLGRYHRSHACATAPTMCRRR